MTFHITSFILFVCITHTHVCRVDEFLSDNNGRHSSLRQQLAAINAELQRLEPANTDLHGSGNIAEDEDDPDALVRRVGPLPAGTEVHHVASTDARCPRRVPPQNAEHGVGRSYVRAFIFFPHPRIVSDNTLSSNDSPVGLGLQHPLAQTPLRHPTSSQTQSHNLMWTIFALIKFKRRLTEYLLLSLWTLIVHETEMEQAKAQEVAQDAIEHKVPRLLSGKERFHHQLQWRSKGRAK